MLRFLLVLVTVGVCSAKVNYKTTKKVISEEEKDRIIAGDDDDAAFDSFLNVYDDIEPEGFRGSTTPEELAAERLRQKRIFVRNIHTIREHNKRYARGEVSYKMVVNSFAVMDEDNRRMFLGLGKDSIDRRPTGGRGLGATRYTSDERDGGLFNTTYTDDGNFPQVGVVSVTSRKGKKKNKGLGSARAATSLDWRSKLGPIKDQGTCGSCWTYPATALLEFAIQKTKGTKLPLSEQELLDCTYESQNYNACKGGWYYQAWDYIIKNSNHLASEASYRYRNYDGACNARHYDSALTGRVKLNSYFKVPASQVIDKMQISPLAVAFFVDNAFYSIGSGVFDGCYTYYASNHAVTLTGYGNGYWEIRNSWGGDWGNRGYGRFKRAGTRSICNLLSDVYGISYSRSDGEEGGEVDPVDPDGCQDNEQHAANCPGWASAGYCQTGDYVQWMAENCQKSCNACEEVEPEPEPEPEPEDDCTDKRSESECRDWKNDYSYCTKGDYVEWMETNCAKTCGVCGEEEEREEEKEVCVDNTEYEASCPDWADDGYCEEDNDYHEWMTTNCKASCGGCEDDREVDPTDGGVDPTDETKGDCENSHDKCDDWADDDYCDHEDYRDYMRTNCQRSCNSCAEPTEPTEPTEPPTKPQPQLIPHSKVSQSSTEKTKVKKKKVLMSADLAVDGDESTRSQTKCTKKDAWFKYKFEEASRVSSVQILNGNFDMRRAKLNGAVVYVQEVDGLKKKCGAVQVRDSSDKNEQTYDIDCGGTYASSMEILQKTKYNKKKCLEMKEVRVYGFEGDVTTGPTGSTGSSTPPEEATEEGEKEEEREREDNNDGCPGGTVRCPDGVCKHIHMCHRG